MSIDMHAVRMFLSELRHNQVITVDGRDYITYNKGGIRSWATLGGVDHSIFQMAIKIEDYYIKQLEERNNVITRRIGFGGAHGQELCAIGKGASSGGTASVVAARNLAPEPHDQAPARTTGKGTSV